MFDPIGPSISELSRQLRESVEKKVSEAIAEARESIEETRRELPGRVAGDGRVLAAREQLGAAFEWGKRLVSSDEAWGEDIGVDDGRRPDRFAYGEHKRTLGELRGEWFGLEARARAFGHASLETLSASIGVETEDGMTNASESEGTRSLPRTDLDLPGTIAANLSMDKIRRVLFEDDGSTEVVFTGEQEPEELPLFERTETFGGLRARLFGEVGILGGSVGAEAFLGLTSHHQRDLGELGSSSYWRHEEEQLDIGVRGAAIADGDILGFEALAHGEAGIRGRIFNAEHFDLFGDSGALIKHELFGFAGAEADAFAEAGPTGVGAGAEAFTGAKAGWRPSAAFTMDGTEWAGAFLDVEGRLGVGANASYELGWDREEGELAFGAEAGTALGLGFSLGGGGIIYTKELGKTFGFDQPVGE